MSTSTPSLDTLDQIATQLPQVKSVNDLNYSLTQLAPNVLNKLGLITLQQYYYEINNHLIYLQMLINQKTVYDHADQHFQKLNHEFERGYLLINDLNYQNPYQGQLLYAYKINDNGYNEVKTPSRKQLYIKIKQYVKSQTKE